MLQLVFAYSGTKTVDGKNEYAFGLNGGLPWGHISQDLKNFKARTKDTTLIMGAKTFASFPEPLPGRKSIVVQDMDRPLVTAKNGFFADAYISDSEFTKLLNKDIAAGSTSYNNTITLNPNENYSVIGGAGLLQKAFPYVDKICVTSIRKRHRVNSDVQIPFEFIYNIFQLKVLETHYYYIDEVTSISEDIFVRK